jgi:hypothetical protein
MDRAEFSCLRHLLASEKVERRLAAVLAADVAGYSRLMGRDEEGTVANLKLFRRSWRSQLPNSHPREYFLFKMRQVSAMPATWGQEYKQLSLMTAMHCQSGCARR